MCTCCSCDSNLVPRTRRSDVCDRTFLGCVSVWVALCDARAFASTTAKSTSAHWLVVIATSFTPSCTTSSPSFDSSKNAPTLPASL